MVKVKIHLNDGKSFEEEIEGFDLAEFVETMNSNSYGRMILLGKLAVSKDSIRMLDIGSSELVEEKE